VPGSRQGALLFNAGSNEQVFFLNPENIFAVRLVVFEKIAPLFPKNDVTEPKARLI